MLKQLMTAGVAYVRDMELKDIAALKFCLAAAGFLVGLTIPARSKKPAGVFAALIFLGTYIPLMFRFFASLTRIREER